MSNSAVRALSGTGFVIIMLFCLLFSKFTFGVLVLLITVGMMVEFYRMTMGDSYVISRIFAIVAAVSLFVLIFCCSAFGLDLKFIALALMPIFLIMINSLYVKDKSEFGRFSNIYTALLYIGTPMALSNLIVFQHGRFSGVLLICFFIITISLVFWCIFLSFFLVNTCCIGISLYCTRCSLILCHCLFR